MALCNTLCNAHCHTHGSTRCCNKHYFTNCNTHVFLSGWAALHGMSLALHGMSLVAPLGRAPQHVACCSTASCGLLHGKSRLTINCNTRFNLRLTITRCNLLQQTLLHKLSRLTITRCNLCLFSCFTSCGLPSRVTACKHMDHLRASIR